MSAVDLDQQASVGVSEAEALYVVAESRANVRGIEIELLSCVTMLAESVRWMIIEPRTHCDGDVSVQLQPEVTVQFTDHLQRGAVEAPMLDVEKLPR
jgi:hypothetical protein